ncbi:LysR substrate-binding domain-containing protein [Streptomyces sp. NPDC006654]|uniref:LysR family transcriptional regulator n=1 Tax=Streptomyces sp. NPDC006654 TaxID=3156897 RepID=UPI0033EEF047
MCHEFELDSRLLRAFVALVDAGDAAAAADHLRLSEPELGRRLDELRGRVGDVLLGTGPHDGALTPAGKLLLPHARHVLAEMRTLACAARSVSEGAGGREEEVVVGAPLPAPPGGLLSEAVRRFRAGHPGVGLRVTEIHDRDARAALADGRVDAVLAWREHAGGAYVDQVLVEEGVDVVLGVDHPLTGSAHVSFADLSGEVVYLPDVRDTYGRQMRAAVPGFRAEQAGSATAAVELAATGHGVAVVPASLRLTAPPRAVFVPVAGASSRLSLLRRDDNRSAATAGFLAACRAVAVGLAVAHPGVWRLPSTAVARPMPSLGGLAHHAGAHGAGDRDERTRSAA